MDHLKYSTKSNLQVENILTDKVQLESWISHGLPDNNHFSYENAVTVLFVSQFNIL